MYCNFAGLGELDESRCKGLAPSYQLGILTAPVTLLRGSIQLGRHLGMVLSLLVKKIATRRAGTFSTNWEISVISFLIFLN